MKVKAFFVMWRVQNVICVTLTKKMKINREELVIGYFATLVAGVLFALGPLGNDLTKEMALFFFKLSVILFVIFRVTKEK